MANRIIGNVLIVDSAMGNAFVVGNDSTSKDFRIDAVGLWSSDSTGLVQFTGTNTTDVVIKLASSSDGSADTTDSIHLNGINIKDVKCPTLTVGTAFIYLA